MSSVLVGFRSRPALRHAVPFVVALLVACADSPSSPRDASAARLRSSALARSEHPPVPTLREEFRDVALRSPGFAGVFMDSVGDLVISASVTGLSPSLRQEAAGWLLSHGRNDLASRVAKLHQVARDHADLDRIVQRVSAQVGRLDGVNTLGIEETSGRVLVGVDDAQDKGTVEEALVSLALPVDAVVIRVLGPSADVTGLQDHFAKMIGGIQIGFFNGVADAACSIGFVGWRRDSIFPSQPDHNYRIFTTASHCTAAEFSVTGTTYGQPLNTSVQVGVEVDEAFVYFGNFYPCLIYMAACRYADVALIKLYDGVFGSGGVAAISSPTVSPNNPPYLGKQAYTGSGVIDAITGETVTKVGATTGQRSGVITHSCLYRQSGKTPGLWTLCAQRAAMFTDGEIAVDRCLFPAVWFRNPPGRGHGVSKRWHIRHVPQPNITYGCGAGIQVLLRMVRRPHTMCTAFSQTTDVIPPVGGIVYQRLAMRSTQSSIWPLQRQRAVCARSPISRCVLVRAKCIRKSADPSCTNDARFVRCRRLRASRYRERGTEADAGTPLPGCS